MALPNWAPLAATVVASISPHEPKNTFFFAFLYYKGSSQFHHFTASGSSSGHRILRRNLQRSFWKLSSLGKPFKVQLDVSGNISTPAVMMCYGHFGDELSRRSKSYVS